jgi:hypothetical protein
MPLNASALVVLGGSGGGVPDSAVLDEGGGALLDEGGGYVLDESDDDDSGGDGTISVGPTAAGEIWQAGFTVAVHCSTNVSEAMCRVYCGAGASPAYFVGSTTWGSTGDSTTNTPQLQVGQQVWAVWTGGDSGATAYLSITGMRTV